MSATLAPTPAPTAATGKTLRTIGLLVLAALAALGYFIYMGIHSRAEAHANLDRETQANAVPTVAVVSPKMADGAEEVVLPGNIQAFQDTPIYARASGYVRQWYADIGAHVKAGQLLAEIEAPELEQQIQQAKADQATALANLQLAQSTANRYQDLLKTESVSKQETDEKLGDLAAKKAVADSASANVRRLMQLQSFEKVTAPFDGVITSRNTDVGALIDAGANTTGKELFHLAAINRLRVYVNVPEAYSRAATPGVHADLTLTEFPNRRFQGLLVRNSSAIDQASRTLMTEVDIDNPSGELLPGAYVSVHLKLPSTVRATTIPVNTLLFRSEGQRVAVVRNDHAVLVPIKIGRDFGTEVEVVSGLGAGDRIILNPPDSLMNNEPVHVADASSGIKQGE